VLPGVDGASPLFNVEEESVSHLLLHCPVSAGVFTSSNLTFEIDAGDNISFVIERWL